MNTGHEGSLSTCHANGPDDALRRLETMVLMGDVALPLVAIREQLTSALDVLVMVSRTSEGRRVTEVAEVVDGAALSGDGARTRRLASGSNVVAEPARRTPEARQPVMYVVLPAVLALLALAATRRAIEAGRRRRAVGRLDLPGAGLSLNRAAAVPRWLTTRLDDAAVVVDGQVFMLIWIAVRAPCRSARSSWAARGWRWRRPPPASWARSSRCGWVPAGVRRGSRRLCPARSKAWPARCAPAGHFDKQWPRRRSRSPARSATTSPPSPRRSSAARRWRRRSRGGSSSVRSRRFAWRRRRWPWEPTRAAPSARHRWRCGHDPRAAGRRGRDTRAGHPGARLGAVIALAPLAFCALASATDRERPRSCSAARPAWCCSRPGSGSTHGRGVDGPHHQGGRVTALFLGLAWAAVVVGGLTTTRPRPARIDQLHSRNRQRRRIGPAQFVGGALHRAGAPVAARPGCRRARRPRRARARWSP